MYEVLRRPSLHGILAIALLSATVLSAKAQASDLADLEKLAGPDLEAVFKQALRGNPPAGVTVEELDGGFVQITVPSREGRPALRQAKAKDLVSCAIYIGLLEPNFSEAGILRFDAAPIADFTYRAGWLVYNTGSNPVTASSSIKTKGPGADLDFEADVTYAPKAFSAVFGTFGGGWKAGVHSITVKVKSAKPSKLKGTLCSGCDF